jgi:transposase
MPPEPPSRPRRDVLRRHGCLNPRPGAVADPLFQGSDFFDPDDLVQVKYEMLRRASADGLSVTEAAGRFGFSRVSFYVAREAFQRAGFVGLLPVKRGPRGGHKLTDEIVAWLLERHRLAPDAPPADLAGDVHARFGVTLHPRSIQRTLATHQKKRL